jgi:glucuronate isomerase
MKNTTFITDDFLLESNEAITLYHDFAKDMPIIDFHSHLPADKIADDHRFKNLAEIWLYGDHYKWRAMRANGVGEKYCTGDAADFEKFEKWAETVPCLIRNPLYHWTHLELARYFSINDRLLNSETAHGIWEEANEKFSKPEFSCRSLIRKFNIEVICTTDDPTDSLEDHNTINMDTEFGVRVLPTWRPDMGMAVDDPGIFNSWLNKLEEVTDVAINNFSSYVEALKKRQEYFHENGCRLSDHGIEEFYNEKYTESEIKAIFFKIRSGATLDFSEILKFKSCMLYFFGIMNHEMGWTQQFHFGVIRNNNSRLFSYLGPDIGCDSIGDFPIAKSLSSFLDKLDKEEKLCRTILYNHNPRDNYLVASMIGNFQDGSEPGKIQMGSAWWFLDQKNGIEQQIEVLSQLGLLSRFVGMVTDSRSFLSFTRHEYFRRILCNILGNDMKKGLIPRDMELIGEIVRDICYNNARRYFRFT